MKGELIPYLVKKQLEQPKPEVKDETAARLELIKEPSIEEAIAEASALSLSTDPGMSFKWFLRLVWYFTPWHRQLIKTPEVKVTLHYTPAPESSVCLKSLCFCICFVFVFPPLSTTKRLLRSCLEGSVLLVVDDYSLMKMDTNRLMKLAMRMSTTRDRRGDMAERHKGNKIRCYAYVYTNGFAIRANNITTYCEANRQVMSFFDSAGVASESFLKSTYISVWFEAWDVRPKDILCLKKSDSVTGSSLFSRFRVCCHSGTVPTSVPGYTPAL